MSNIDKQALREEFQYMQDHYSDPADRDRQVIYIAAEALLDELERKEEQRANWFQMAQKLGSELDAAEKRIAELERERVAMEAVTLAKREEMRTSPPAPLVPNGLVMVPVEPTEDMIVQGFESEPDESFSDADVWEAYEAMSGCQQEAHRAKLCWSAMLTAAPKPEA
ncbi:hypothetical protein [Enterobacter roggenkampii]|uniref:hypothetical protein n=1 Tax=Enterobacter roggenkampii TaxID=1812935 RepID=UPI002A8190E2|nr:hypothetical protein [Enterobacter roggenkampii]